MSFKEKLQHCRALSVATDIPTNADFENGYSEDIIDVVENIKRLAETGIAGFSIEDFSHERRTYFEG